jgi:hypothetical protein
MNSRSVLVAMTITALAVPASSTAQAVSADVTLKFPLNLTQLPPDVSKVRVECVISSAAITDAEPGLAGTSFAPGTPRYVRKTQEFPVSGGQVVTAVTLLFSFTALNDPVGKTADIICQLWGWTISVQSWNALGETSAVPALRTIRASEQAITSSFVW